MNMPPAIADLIDLDAPPGRSLDIVRAGMPANWTVERGFFERHIQQQFFANRG